MRDKKESKIESSGESILLIKRLRLLDGLLKQHIAAQVGKLARSVVQKNYNILTFPLRLIKLPAKTAFSFANIALNTSSISFFRRTAPNVVIGRFGESQYWAGEERKFELSHYVQAALFCQPALDFFKETLDELPDFYRLGPKATKKLMSGKKLPEERLENRTIPKKDLASGNIDLNEMVKLLEADFPDIYRDYAISSLETSLSGGPGI